MDTAEGLCGVSSEYVYRFACGVLDGSNNYHAKNVVALVVDCMGDSMARSKMIGKGTVIDASGWECKAMFLVPQIVENTR